MIEPLALGPALKCRSNRRELLRRVAHRVRSNPNANNKLVPTPRQYQDYFKFTIVRNPWTRAASLYKNVIRDEIHRRELGVSENTTLAEFLNAHAGRGMLRPQLDWIRNWQGTVPLDFICRFERLSQDFDVVLSKIGNPPIQLPRINTAQSGAAAPQFDEQLNRLIADTYAKEIALFGYAAPGS